MPTSASGANNQDPGRSESDEVFDAIKGLDDGVDNLFGQAYIKFISLSELNP